MGVGLSFDSELGWGNSTKPMISLYFNGTNIYPI